MRVSPDIYDATVTLINKLDAKDAALASDAYYKTVLHGVMWSDSTTRTVGSDGTVSIATSHNVQLPDFERYLPYREWCKAENRQDCFTVREGDWVVLGEVAEEVTSSTVRKVVALYEPDAFQVQSFRDLTHDSGLAYANAGWLRFAEVLSIEG